jgi:hypothetical protein
MVTVAFATARPSGSRTWPETWCDGAAASAKFWTVVVPSLMTTPVAVSLTSPKALAVTS